MGLVEDAMRLIIAEKPSLARAIADVLPGPQRRVGESIECGGGTTVAWCAGHILEAAPPEAYAPEYKQWRLDHLPIMPDQWKLEVTTAKLLQTIAGLLRKAQRVVHAGDPDREGQLLVDEVLDYLGWTGPTDRLLINDLSPAAVERALAGLQPNQQFRPLSCAALARQRADWLYGLNLTRLYTLLGRQAGYDGLLSVGRVQTPLLGLIVRRDREIEGFVSKPYYGVVATMRTASGAVFRGSWAVGKEHQVHTDPEGRLLVREVAEAVRERTSGQPAVITRHEQKKHSEPAPLPYSLAHLQMDGGRRWGMSAAQVLEAAQSLYERHKLTTYPRSDCSYLPKGHLQQAAAVLSAIARHTPALAGACAQADGALRSRAWNDSKVTAHHAIIPTPNSPHSVVLSDAEQAVYELIAQRYVQQFLPAFEYLQTTVEMAIAGETFVARGRQVLALGWKALQPDPAKELLEGEDEAETGASSVDGLPPMREGERLVDELSTVTERRTRPPQPFTDATLIQAMCNIAKYVSDPKARKILEEADGIGTPATRASIIETLFARNYVERRGKQIRSTETGRLLVAGLPAVATTPDMTALWESAMARISQGHLSLDHFLGVVGRQLGELITRGKAQGSLVVPVAHPCTQQGCKGHLRRLKGTKGTSWSCSVCRTTADDARGPAQTRRGGQAVAPGAGARPRSRKGNRRRAGGLSL